MSLLSKELLGNKQDEVMNKFRGSVVAEVDWPVAGMVRIHPLLIYLLFYHMCPSILLFNLLLYIVVWSFFILFFIFI